MTRFNLAEPAAHTAMTAVLAYIARRPRTGRPVALKYAVTRRRSSPWNDERRAYLTRTPSPSSGVGMLEDDALMIHYLALEAALVIVAAHEFHAVAEISVHEQPGSESHDGEHFPPGEAT